MLFVPGPLVVEHRARLLELALKHTLPTVFSSRPFATAGGLIAYGAMTDDLCRRASTYVDKILKGGQAGGSTSGAAPVKARTGGFP
jgi:putative ABC transport system substrate-binding protein